MAYKKDFTIPQELLEQISEQGFEYLPEMIRVIINAAMQNEREKYLGAEYYERNPNRKGHANGYKNKTVQTRIGSIDFSVPQVREGGFYPHALEKGLRSEKALMITLAEMYVQGVSTRRVSAIVEQMSGSSISSAQVSKAMGMLDETLNQWREAPIGETPYLFLDARYEKVRQDGEVRDAAVLIAYGIIPDGHRKILGVSVSLSEQEVHWRHFLEKLVQRGLRGVKLITSDDHAGLGNARKAIFGGIPWQRCQFHLQQNAQAYIPKKDMQSEVFTDIRNIFNAPDRSIADSYLKSTVLKYAHCAKKLSEWMETNIPEGLTCFSFPAEHRRLIRTNNSTERLNREIRRRTRVVSIFPNEGSCLRLVSAVLMEISDDWEGGKVYLNMAPS